MRGIGVLSRLPFPDFRINPFQSDNQCPTLGSFFDCPESSTSPIRSYFWLAQVWDKPTLTYRVLALTLSAYYSDRLGWDLTQTIAVSLLGSIVKEQWSARPGGFQGSINYQGS